MSTVNQSQTNHSNSNQISNNNQISQAQQTQFNNMQNQQKQFTKKKQGSYQFKEQNNSMYQEESVALSQPNFKKYAPKVNSASTKLKGWIKYSAIIAILVIGVLIIFLFTQYPLVSDNVQQNIERHEKNFIKDIEKNVQIQNLIETIRQPEQCPKNKRYFHVLVAQNQQLAKQKYSKLPSYLRKRIQQCFIRVVMNKQLVQYTQRWNSQFKAQILLEQYNEEQTENLLKLLHLFYTGGKYLSMDINFKQLNQKCWDKVIYGSDEVLFIQIQTITQNGVHVPSGKNFMGVRYKNTAIVAKMIEKMILKQHYLQNCKTRNCLIVNCWNKQ